MIYATLDSLVRNAVYDRGFSIHYYLPFLSFALKALSDINIDRDGHIKTVNLSVNEIGLAKLPCDYVDWVRVGQLNGEYNIPFEYNNAFSNALPMTDGIVSAPPQGGVDISDYALNFSFTDYANSNGESVGRFFGVGLGTPANAFKVLPELEAAKFQISWAGKEVEMDYLTWSPVTASSRVHKYLEGYILAYMDYKWEQRVKGKNTMLLKKELSSEFKKMTGRLNRITAIDIANGIRRSFRQVPKL